MVKIKSKADASKRYKDSIGRIPTAYKDAVSKVTDWQEKALAGQGLFETQMSNPEILARRGKAIATVTNDYWRKHAVALGGARISEGMRAKSDVQSANWSPYHDVLSALDLPAKTADPMANIDNRVKGVVGALVSKKKEILG